MSSLDHDVVSLAIVAKRFVFDFLYLVAGTVEILYRQPMRKLNHDEEPEEHFRLSVPLVF